MRRRGLTGLECLLIGAVLLVVAGVTYPALKNAQEMARTPMCPSNIRELTVALNTYVADYDSTLPSRIHSTYRAWATQCLPYINKRQVYMGTGKKQAQATN